MNGVYVGKKCTWHNSSLTRHIHFVHWPGECHVSDPTEQVRVGPWELYAEKIDVDEASWGDFGHSCFTLSNQDILGR